MGRDKVESSYYSIFACSSHSSLTYWCVTDEDLIKYAWPQDIWFHVDKLSSAHVYLRLPESISSWETIPEPLLVDCAQLVKANSIEGDPKIVSGFLSSSSEPDFFRQQAHRPHDHIHARRQSEGGHAATLTQIRDSRSCVA